MNRRDFFRLGVRKTAEAAYRQASEKAARQAAGWFRPPFAQAELGFQLACTRCDKCVEACTYGVIFKLPVRLGPGAAGTPAMDLVNRGCHMCSDWPCVTACEPNALRFPDQGEEAAAAPAKLAHVRIDPNACLPYSGPECGACADSCPVPGALEWEDGLRPFINEQSCTGCALCREACIMDPQAIEVAAFIPDDEVMAPDDEVIAGVS